MGSAVAGAWVLLWALSEAAGATDAAALYQADCAVCHGEHGDGRTHARGSLSPPPRDFTSAQAAAELSRERMLASVRHGRPGTAMAAWGERLSAAEIEALVDHIRAKFMPQGASAASGDDPADPTRPLPAGLVGEATRGRALYLANCVACHGAEGDGQGPRAYFIVPGPRNFRDPGARRIYDRPRLYRAIARGKLGSEMPAWDTVLTAQEIADLAEFVFRAYLHGPAGARR